MDIPFYQIDAFTDRVFSGNPAGVCFLKAWLDDALMQSIAFENNLSETAFLVKRDAGYELRWFTPKAEVELCGHATLASAFAIFNWAEPARTEVGFQTKSGLLTVRREEGGLLCLDFPARPAQPIPAPEGLARILGATPAEIWRARDLMAVYENEDQIKNLKPDQAGIVGLGLRAVMVTAPGRRSDFVSRFFAPGLGVAEDPVTGSAHTTLIPYWSARLGRKRLHAFQLSERGGELFCEDRGERVAIGGRAAAYLSGTIRV